MRQRVGNARYRPHRRGCHSAGTHPGRTPPLGRLPPPRSHPAPRALLPDPLRPPVRRIHHLLGTRRPGCLGANDPRKPSPPTSPLGHPFRPAGAAPHLRPLRPGWLEEEAHVLRGHRSARPRRPRRIPPQDRMGLPGRPAHHLQGTGPRRSRLTPLQRARKCLALRRLSRRPRRIRRQRHPHVS